MDAGERPCLVVSALGITTDILIETASRVTDSTAGCEVDALLATGELQAAALMALALNNLGVKAISVNGTQMGVITDGDPGESRIIRIEKAPQMRSLIDKGYVLVCAGFQGVNSQDRIRTLRRGGSNLSAVAIAHSIGAARLVNCTDSPVCAFDPRLETSRPPYTFPHVSYDQMLSMSTAGAGVLMDRSVFLAQKLGIPIQVTTSPSLNGDLTKLHPGTMVSYNNGNGRLEGDDDTRGALPTQKKASVIVLSNLPDEPGVAADIFEALDDIVIGEAYQGDTTKSASLAFWLPTTSVETALNRLRPLEQEKGWTREIRTGSALTLVHPAMKDAPRYLARASRALANAGVNIQMIGSAGICISYLIAEADLIRAVEAMAHEFNLFAEEE